MKRITFLVLIVLVLLSACSNEPAANNPTPNYPTPTSYHLFSSNSTPFPAGTGNPNETPLAPTLANIFQTFSGITPSPTNNQQAGQPTDLPVNINPTASAPGKSIPIFDDKFNVNWEMLASQRMAVDPENTDFTYAGSKSIAITPGEDFGTVYFVVQPSSKEIYSRDRVLGFHFMLNSGNDIIEPQNLAVTVIGSNQYNYFATGDNSVTNAVDPIFPETRLYFLGINQAIPPHTWVDITVWLDNLVYDPIYKNVTGFYIKNDEGFRNTFYMDDIQIITLADQQAANLPTANAATPGSSTTGTKVVNPNDLITSVQVNVDLQKNVHPISPMIYGVTNASRDILYDLRPGLNNWGGNSSSRYNWQLGNAWNTGGDDHYSNTDNGNLSGSASDRFVDQTRTIGAATRITLPILGWVARNTNPQTCSFPLPDGTCGDANKASCLNPGDIADPNLANVPSDVNFIVDWVHHLIKERGYNINIFALGNEPDLWGITHYDVHPQCTTYAEVLQKYLEYAGPVREIAPKAMLAGPSLSGWNDYWSFPAGPADKQTNGNEKFLPWFLDQLKKHDTGQASQSIDVLDIHYFPAGLNNQDVDAATAEHRLRAPRSLWDPTYVDESEINQPVNLIPSMKDLIAKHYPGLQLGISAWDFGADQNINGALAIADVLGIFGREDVYYASYAGYPQKDSPSAFAFKMYTNYDGNSNGFGDTSVLAQSENPDLIGAYAAVEQRTGKIHLMLINKNPKNNLKVKVNIADFKAPIRTVLYRYSREHLSQVISSNIKWPENGELDIPPYSISHYIITP